MPVDIAVNVDYYRSDDIDGSRTFLQSPVSPKRQPGKKRLVRQDQGKHKNQVSFEPLAQMTKVGSGCYSTYAHGVLIKSSLDQSYRQGDRVWLTETAQVGRNVSVQNQRSIGAVSLRTWERMTLALGDVCWIPKFRKIDCGVHEEELLTISGPPVKKKDRKLYLLAIVQRLRVVNGITIVESVELREIVEQGSFKYQNLTLLPDGKWRISELFHRSLASVAPAFFEMVLERPTTNPSNTGMPQVGRASDQITSLATPPPEDDLDLRRTAQRCEPLIPAVPPPEDMRNLGEWCPTPYRASFHANQPSIENPYPRHQHRPDHECSIGGEHLIHCAFGFLEGTNVLDRSLCIIPATVQHRCCEMNAEQPINEQFYRRPEMIDGGRGSVQVTGGMGTTSMVPWGEQETEQYCDVPVEARSMPFVPERDLDEMGRHAYGYEAGVGGFDGGGSSTRPLPGDYTGYGFGEDGIGFGEDSIGFGEDGIGFGEDDSGFGEDGIGFGEDGIGFGEDGIAYGEDGIAAGQCQLHAVPGLSREHQQIHQGRPCVLADRSPGSASHPIVSEGRDEGEEEPDVFGDQHCHGDDISMRWSFMMTETDTNAEWGHTGFSHF